MRVLGTVEFQYDRGGLNRNKAPPSYVGGASRGPYRNDDGVVEDEGPPLGMVEQGTVKLNCSVKGSIEPPPTTMGSDDGDCLQ